MTDDENGPYMCRLNECSRVVPFDSIKGLKIHLAESHGIDKFGQNILLTIWGYSDSMKNIEKKAEKLGISLEDLLL